MYKPIRSSWFNAGMSRLIAAGIAVGLGVVLVAQPQGSSGDVERRIDGLIKQMTVEEKIGQLNMSFHFMRGKAEDDKVVAGQVGSYVHEYGIAEINRLQKLAVEKSRLHIPLIFEADVVHGYRIIYPVPLGLAASWDVNLIEEVQKRAAFEARTAGQQWNASPMLDIVRDPRWGRIVEGAGEDPYLGSKVAVAQVKGFQGTRPIDSNHMIVSLKHFAGYGASEGGRDHDAANLTEAQLRNVYLKPFKAAVEAGAGTIMTAYMDLDDVPATGNRWLLNDVLHKEWKFGGLVVSDNNAVSDLLKHGFARDAEDASKRALYAGVDVAMSNFGADAAGLLTAAKNGTLEMEELDRSVRRMLRMKFEMGLFENPYADEKGMDETTAREHMQVARTAAARSAVLLRNEGNLLPLRADAHRKVALIGPLGDTRENILGPWVDGHELARVATLRQALEKSGKFREVAYAQGVQISRLYPSPFDRKFTEKPAVWSPEQSDQEFKSAIEVARGSDLVIAAMGEMQNMSGESASRASLALPGRQSELLQAVAALGKPVVLVLFNGRPLSIPWEAEHIPAILEMWFPGTEGANATLDLLFGDAVPAGKLPVTWPRDANQVPIYYSHNKTQDAEGQGKRYWDVPSTPLFPFGYGLSYTQFSFAVPKAAASEIKIGQPVTIETEVTNSGDVAGDVVAQLYIHQRYGSASRPIRELKGFERVALQPHQKKAVRFVLSPDDLAFWSAAKRAWTHEASTFDFWVGEDSTAKLAGTFTVTP